jgi:lactate dehydrogenase-like 2-hydroxyacid dehydrogenase
MSRVLITDYVTDPDIERRVLGSDLTAVASDDVRVLLVWHQRIDDAYVERFPRLRGVVRYGVGYDCLDLECLHRRGIVACNTPDYGTEEVADTAFAMILNIVRGVSRYDTLCRGYEDGSWQTNILPALRRTSEVTLGVIGAGRIGGSVILRAHAMRMKTIFHDPYKDRGYEKMLGSERVDRLEELLARSDIVSVHAPLTAETAGMVDARFIAAMKPGASFVNTARGAIVEDLEIFHEPLRAGALDCIALDVLPEEPPPETPLLSAWRRREPWLDGRMTVNPHTAFYSDTAFREMREKAALNALRILSGETPYNILRHDDRLPGAPQTSLRNWTEPVPGGGSGTTAPLSLVEGGSARE